MKAWKAVCCGIEDVLQLIYASNTVCHIMSGNAVSRAVRGHFIVDTSLHSLLAAKVLGITLPAGNSDAHQNTQGMLSSINTFLIRQLTRRPNVPSLHKCIEMS